MESSAETTSKEVISGDDLTSGGDLEGVESTAETASKEVISEDDPTSGGDLEGWNRLQKQPPRR